MSEWFSDGHKIRAVLDGDAIKPVVLCPVIDQGLAPAKRCEACDGHGATVKENKEKPLQSEFIDCKECGASGFVGRDALACGVDHGRSAYCDVAQQVKEYGWELNETGLPIHVKSDLPIIYRYEGDGELYFCMAGFPDTRSVQSAKTRIKEKYGLQSIWGVPWEAVDVLVCSTTLSEQERDEEIRTILERHGLIGEPADG